MLPQILYQQHCRKGTQIEEALQGAHQTHTLEQQNLEEGILDTLMRVEEGKLQVVGILRVEEDSQYFLDNQEQLGKCWFLDTLSLLSEVEDNCCFEQWWMEPEDMHWFLGIQRVEGSW